ncbi:hypothetical protein FIBSPDRAFT_539288 [Athelia psychrophila]|uniref:Uncharacterized protein n=1 Tax=Athelia psychrophila TaxID=1759441 RepID=A0A166J326_9AGAM|nr:hypothetical protein FIBSPDRAFT_539288 [Fibularhizoctonia sp. CBS 109695]
MTRHSTGTTYMRCRRRGIWESHDAFQTMTLNTNADSPATRRFYHLTIPSQYIPIIPGKTNRNGRLPTTIAVSRDATTLNRLRCIHPISSFTAPNAGHYQSTMAAPHVMCMRLCHHRLIAVPYHPHSHQRSRGDDGAVSSPRKPVTVLHGGADLPATSGIVGGSSEDGDRNVGRTFKHQDSDLMLCASCLFGATISACA